MDIMVFFTLLFLVIYISWRFTVHKRHQKNMQIYLDVIGNQEHVLISPMTLPHYNTMYHFTATSFMERLMVHPGIRPTLHIQWSSFPIKHKILDKELKLPRTVNINWYQMRKVQSIIMESFEALLFTRNGNSNNYVLIPVQGTTWQ
jgi:hypothetical protein